MKARARSYPALLRRAAASIPYWAIFPKPPNSPNQSVGLAITNGGLYDLRGGSLFLNTRVNSGGTFQFDGGQNLGTFTLEAGGTVTSSGTETIQTPFFQLGGTNATTKLAVVGSVDFGFGSYDLQGGTLNAGTITVGGSGAFYFDGGVANFTTFNQTRGTVASGTAASLASAAAHLYFGTGSEIVSAAGSLTPSSVAGGTPTVSGGATVNQSDGANYAGALTLGLNGGIGVYNLSGGGTLNAIREMIGGDSASAGLFNQTGGTNSLENALGGDFGECRRRQPL